VPSSLPCSLPRLCMLSLPISITLSLSPSPSFPLSLPLYPSLSPSSLPQRVSCQFLTLFLPTAQLPDGDLRLAGVGSNHLAGRLEIYHNGQWGTVCGGLPGEDFLSNFDARAASIACAQMGLGYAVDFYSALNLPEQRYMLLIFEASVCSR
jgi:hypothetical protein